MRQVWIEKVDSLKEICVNNVPFGLPLLSIRIIMASFHSDGKCQT